MWRIILILVLSGGLSGAAIPDVDCVMDEDSRQWIQAALDVWAALGPDRMREETLPLPEIWLVDSVCLWRLTSGSEDSVGLWYGARSLSLEPSRHQGHIDTGATTLDVRPEGRTLRIRGGVVSVLPLPSLWAKHPLTPRDPAELQRFATGALVHEMVHAWQMKRWATEPRRLGGLGPGIDDRVLGDSLASRPDTGPAFESERALLALAARTDSERIRYRALARALASMRRRRAELLVRGDAALVSAERLFIDMEGYATWVAWECERIAPQFVSVSWQIDGERMQELGWATYRLLDLLAPRWRERVVVAREDPFTVLNESLERRWREAAGSP